MKILITGGTGFIGTHLVNALGNKHEILISNKNNLAQNLTDKDLDGTDLIFHLGATSRVGISLENPEGTLHNNYDSTLRLLDWCRHNPKTSMINISSSSAKFADVKSNPYALSKLIGEQLVDVYRKSFDVNAVSVRLFNVYGPGEAEFGKHTTLLKACKDRYLKKENLLIYGNGSIRRDYTHVSDVISGLLVISKLVLAKSLTTISIFELGRMQATSSKQIAQEFVFGTDLSIDYVGDRNKADPPLTEADVRFTPPGWKAEIDVLQHIRDWRDSLER